MNELIQRYHLVTYDYFAYEVSVWDVPIWYLKQSGAGRHAVLLPYKTWDRKPVTVEESEAPDKARVKPFQWATPPDLDAIPSADLAVVT